MTKSIVALFPGQGEQHIGMGKALHDHFIEAKELFQYADDLLERNLSKLMFSGEPEELTETRNSQLAIFVHSMAAHTVLKKEIPHLEFVASAGHSLGEYSALVLAGVLDFKTALLLVRARANSMSAACAEQKGAMAAVIGLSEEQIKELIEGARLPNDLWAANFNCPGQVVLSGTEKGIAKAIELAKANGARRAIPLKVQGAFHSGLMKPAENAYRPFVEEAEISKPQVKLVMNVTGGFEVSPEQIRENMIKQITGSVLWTRSVESLKTLAPELFLEIGPGKMLAGLHKRMLKEVPISSFGTPEDLESILALTS